MASGSANNTLPGDGGLLSLTPENSGKAEQNKVKTEHVGYALSLPDNTKKVWVDKRTYLVQRPGQPVRPAVPLSLSPLGGKMQLQQSLLDPHPHERFLPPAT